MVGVGRWRRAARSHPFGTDLVTAVALGSPAVVDNATNVWHTGVTVNVPVILVAVAVGYGTLPGRRRWPVVSAAAAVLAAAVYVSLSGLYWWITPAPMIALHHLAGAGGDRRRLALAGGLTVLVLVGIPLLVTFGPWWDTTWPHGMIAAVVAACGLALAAGDAARSRRVYLAEVERRAHQAEHGREQEARRRVAEERLRIARDLHDSVGQHLALINAQAGMAEHVFGDQPATARQALGHIKQTSRAALDDLRGTVALLRQPTATPTAPAAGIGDIAGLVAAFRRSGMRVAYEIDGPARPLPPAADLTAYRVVQESLTNAGKHADGTPVRVRLTFGPRELQLLVENDGTGRRTPNGQDGAHESGHGIAGMAERVSAVGGRLDAGPRPGGGFGVNAVLPLPGNARR